jgi:hypothetical protein
LEAGCPQLLGVNGQLSCSRNSSHCDTLTDNVLDNTTVVLGASDAAADAGFTLRRQGELRFARWFALDNTAVVLGASDAAADAGFPLQRRGELRFARWFALDNTAVLGASDAATDAGFTLQRQ